jgi:hypothetical protein
LGGITKAEKRCTLALYRSASWIATSVALAAQAEKSVGTRIFFMTVVVKSN